MIREDQCLPLPENYAGHVLVLRPSCLGHRYQRPKFQLVSVTGGFGCQPDKIGTKVYGTYLADEEDSEFRRGDFIGEASPELISEALADPSGPDPINPHRMTYLALGSGCWGKGETIKEAKKKCRAAGGTPAEVLYCHEETRIEDFFLRWPNGVPEPVSVWKSAAQKKREAA